jgi:hypothetical protein
MKRWTILGASVLFAIQAATAGAAIPQPLSPSGPIRDDLPSFKWTDTGAALYSVEVKDDEAVYRLFTSAVPKVAVSELPAGVYRWRVKGGVVFGGTDWSGPLFFTVYPNSPNPSVPSSRLTTVPTAPTFQWTRHDSRVNLFTIQLYRGEDLLDTLSVTGHPVSPTTLNTVWPSALPAGTYKWRIKGIRTHDKPDHTLKSDWSAFRAFTVGVPGQPFISKPTSGVTLSPGFYAVALEWSKPEGTASSIVKVLRHGEELVKWENVATNKINIFRTWDPGHYVLLVRAVNVHGLGAWAVPRPFLITRTMTPGNDQVALVPTNRLEWTRSEIATRYRVRLFRANPDTGNYELLKEASVDQPAGSPFWKPGVLGTGAYRWQVTDFDGDKALYTSTGYFSVIVPARPEAEYPGPYVIGLTGIDFGWRAASGAATHYQFRILKNGGLVTATGWKAPGDLTKGPDIYSLTYSLAASGPGTYHWQVRAKNAAGTGGWRDTKIKCEEFAVSSFIQPADNRSFAAGTPITIKWRAIYNTGIYQIQFQHNGTVQKEWATRSGGAIESYAWLVGSGVWTVRVRAVGHGFGPWASLTITGL